ncbi:calcium-binding protein [Nostoc sp. NMS9]|uniref:calcium-binding protein n=1 Tax=Nostoc sp. NMS9 TaxID=2815393 RepID=UPI0025F4B41D|nr:calcium-binding protein [Nostoc sp. NMS9]MBN3942351.1 hypothetical protein [Nostoc sp. NMS9]
MSNKYLRKVVAKTTDSVSSGGNITGFLDTISINDSGLVAFIGKFGSIQDLLVGDGSNPIRNLSSNFSTNSSFAAGVEINNNNQVVAIDRGNGFSAIRLWDANNPGSFSKNLGTARFPPDNVDFENILSFPSLNNKSPVGQAVFAVTPKGEFPKIALATLASDSGLFGGRTYNQAILANNSGVRPAISDSGLIVARDFSTKIILQDYQLNITDVIASDIKGFTSVGLAPGISNDGNVVVFYGNYSGTGDDPLPGLQPGAGNDNLNAGAGNDSLNGGAGNDSLSGGTGNDTYIVDSLGDSIIENANEGTDAVQSSVDWTLGENLEYLMLIGTDAINGTGNALNNRISGNTVNNTLIGGNGNDSLNGQAGNDNLDAGAGNDSLNGGADNDTLNGGDGNDYLYGEAGISSTVVLAMIILTQAQVSIMSWVVWAMTISL